MFCAIPCRWSRSTVSHLSLTAPRHFYYQHTWDEYLCLTPQSRLRVQSIFQGNSGSVQQKIEQKLGWQKKNRPLKFKIFLSVKESEESNIILVWISTLRRLLCFALHLGKSNFLSLKLEQWSSNVLCESKWRRVTPGAKNAGNSLYFWPAGVGEGRGFQEEGRGEKALERFRVRVIHRHPTLDQHVLSVYRPDPSTRLFSLAVRKAAGGCRGSWSRTPAPFSRKSRIPNFSPNTVFFPASRANPASRVAFNQVKTFFIFRIPHCISIKSRPLEWPPRHKTRPYSMLYSRPRL